MTLPPAQFCGSIGAILRVDGGEGLAGGET